MTFDKSVVVPLDPDSTFALFTEPEGSAMVASPPAWSYGQEVTIGGR